MADNDASGGVNITIGYVFAFFGGVENLGCCELVVGGTTFIAWFWSASLSANDQFAPLEEKARLCG